MSDSQKNGVSIVIPAYNEEQNIAETIDALINSPRLKEINCEVVVVDDGSKDRTAEIVRSYPVRLVRHEENRGYGAALKTGIRLARYDTIAMADADGSYPVASIYDLIALMDEYDMVVGARNGTYAKVNFTRHAIKWFLNKYANYLVKYKIPDLNSGMRVFKKDVFEKYRNLLPNGFSFTTTITLALLANDYRVKYAPIDYFSRGGRSKFRPIRDTLNFIVLITRTSLYFNPLRVYLPIAFVFLILGLGLLGYDIFVLRDISDKTTMVFLWGIQFGMVGLLADMISHRR